MRPLEAVYLILAIGIIVRGTIDHGLTIQEAGVALFLFGLVPVTRADRMTHDSPEGFIRTALLAWLTKGGER